MRSMLVVLTTLFLSLTPSLTFAAKKASLMRGGYGILFSDTNSFNNAGEFSRLRGFAAQAHYEKERLTQTDVVVPSLVAGTGRVGLGVFAARAGQDLGDNNLTTDVIGAGAGFNFAKGLMSVGGVYQRVVESGVTNDGVVTANFTLHPVGRGGSGFSAGVQGSTTLNNGTEVRTATAGVGYAFNPMVMIEALGRLNNWDDKRDYTLASFVTISGAKAYFSGGTSYVKINEEFEAVGRVGVVIKQTVDFSVEAAKVLRTGRDVDYGASVRVSF